MLCLLGNDKPIIEFLQPNSINQTDSLEKQFKGLSDVEFSYADYEEARVNLITQVNAALHIRYYILNCDSVLTSSDIRERIPLTNRTRACSKEAINICQK